MLRLRKEGLTLGTKKLRCRTQGCPGLIEGGGGPNGALVPFIGAWRWASWPPVKRPEVAVAQAP